MVDPRGPRFAAAVTVVVLAAAIITGSPWVLLAQAAVFAVGSLAGIRHAPYGLVFRYLIRPRLGPPAEMEAEAPPRFAQTVGLMFTLVGAVGLLAGVPALGYTLAAFAFVAAFLNAVFGLCLGCRMYLVLRSITAKGVRA
ncbi:hypothetical protein CC117_03135 [Parafrankia colletiae]|uniref:DUF4395 domain-containing protein n=1 Tax=Parafrankia colletiae TaxID=573497 RepID=A0A1S1QVK2_9ACTN|nr:DUF4395 domain-containing protein [Parafrankia colletiae]MCK9899192.1 DUF4395 domain-containing protein [Frankia sp. Cpl3]OHV38738.1 hypothetical protein CC117_03135 [Parafrankia colletiae]